MPDSRCRRAGSARDAGTLKLRSFTQGNARVIALAEEFDGSTMKQVERELADAKGTDAQVIVLDLRLLEFLESSRLRVVVVTSLRPAAGDTPG